MQTVLSIVAVVMSALSLGWQAATFALSGGRIKAELLAAAHHGGNRSMIVGKAADAGDVWSEANLAQGFVTPAIGVRVWAAGRTAVTVEKCSLAIRYYKPGPQSLFLPPPVGELMLTPTNWSGNPLPHLMNAGSASAIWTTSAQEVGQVAKSAMKALGVEKVWIEAVVELSNGRTRKAGGKLDL